MRGNGDHMGLFKLPTGMSRRVKASLKALQLQAFRH